MKKYRRRPRLTEAEKVMMWNRWQQGDSLHAIARLLDTTHTSVRRHLVVTGGIRPPRRKRSKLALSPSEREEISRGIVAGLSVRLIATTLGRSPSTVSRELRRNGGQQHYRANVADQAAWDRARRPKTCKLTQNPALALIVARQLKSWWSPEQIAGWLKRTYPDDENYQVSHETIYRTLFIQARGALKKELLQYLRRTRGMRRSRHHTQKTPDHGRIKDTVSIRERPAEAEDRALPGHWEGDLLIGSHSSQIATLVERHSRSTSLRTPLPSDQRLDEAASPDTVAANAIWPAFSISMSVLKKIKKGDAFLMTILRLSSMFYEYGQCMQTDPTALMVSLAANRS